MASKRQSVGERAVGLVLGKVKAAERLLDRLHIIPPLQGLIASIISSEPSSTTHSRPPLRQTAVQVSTPQPLGDRQSSPSIISLRSASTPESSSPQTLRYKRRRHPDPPEDSHERPSSMPQHAYLIGPADSPMAQATDIETYGEDEDEDHNSVSFELTFNGDALREFLAKWEATPAADDECAPRIDTDLAVPATSRVHEMGHDVFFHKLYPHW